MIHSFLVTIVGVDSPDAGTMDAMLDAFEIAIASVEEAGPMAAGEPTVEGFDPAGDAMTGVAR